LRNAEANDCAGSDLTARLRSGACATRLTPGWLRRLSSDARFDAVAITHQHIHTVRPTTDNQTYRRARHTVSPLHAASGVRD
jgi:hypothetical protein